MNEQAEEANDCPPPWPRLPEVWERLSAALSGEIADEK